MEPSAPRGTVVERTPDPGRMRGLRWTSAAIVAFGGATVNRRGARERTSGDTDGARRGRSSAASRPGCRCLYSTVNGVRIPSW
jgi:hypothetical protein